MNFEDYRRHDAMGLAKLIADEEVSAAEVLEAAIARANAVNPAINAVVHRQFLEARAAAAVDGGLGDGPLKGVPYLIKDLGFFEKGQPATFGSRLFADYVADFDSAYVRRCKEAGLNIMGRSNSPAFGLSANTEPKLHGSCRNPWNLEHSAGGSSGGAGAAVAAGILPMAHATDGGGSTRIPAAHCGLFGLKPTRGRISFAPGGEGWGGLSISHVNSRSVRDSALMLDLTGGPEPGDPYAAPAPERPFLEEVGRPPGQLRIAMMVKTQRGTDFHPDNLKAIHDAGALCESLGHVVEEARPDIDLVALRELTAVVARVQVARTLRARWAALGESPNPDKVERVVWAAYEIGRDFGAMDYAEAIAAIHDAGRAFAAFMANYDVVLAATTTAPPPKLGYLDMDGDPKTFAARSSEFVSVTPLHNATGTPAMSVPLHWNDDGLPIGVHFAGRYGDEATLFRLAAQLEEARPWFDRVPAL